MKSVCIGLSLLLSFFAYSQNKLDVIPKHPNAVDSRGMRQGWWTIELNDDMMRPANPDDVVYYRIIQFKDDVPVGVTRDYYKSGVLYEELTLQSLKFIGKRNFRQEVDYSQPYNVYWEDGSENLIAPNRIQCEAHLKNERYDLALPFAEKAMAETEKRLGKNNWRYAYFLSTLGHIYQALGYLTKAEPLYVEHIKVVDALPDKKGVQYVNCVVNLAYLYYIMGDYYNSRRLYQMQLERAESVFGKNSLAYATALNNMALVYDKMWNFKQAAETYRQSLTIREQEIEKKNLEQDLGYATTLNNLAATLTAQNRFAEAQKYIQHAIQITQNAVGKENSAYAGRIIFLSSIFELAGKYKQADSVNQVALAITRKIQGTGHPSYTARLLENAHLYRVMGSYDKAEDNYLKGIEGLNRQILSYFPALSDYQKTSYYFDQQYNFEDFNSFCVARAKQNPAILTHLYNNQLATKAMLLNATSKWKHRIRNSGDKKLFALYTDWEANQNTLARWYKEKEGAALKSKKIDSLEVLVTLQEKELSRRSEMFGTIAEKKPVTWQDIKTKLKPDEVAIEMIRVKKYGSVAILDSSDAVLKRYTRHGLTDTIQYAALILTPNSTCPELVLISNGNELDGKQSKFYFNAIRTQTEDNQSYGFYWKPIADKLASMKIKGPGRLKVYFSPDGIYNNINVNTLYNPATKKYLFEETNVGLVTNTKDLVSVKKEETENNLAYLIGFPDYGISTEERSKLAQNEKDRQRTYYSLRLERSDNLVELPGTKTEVENIAALMTAKGWQPEVLVGSKAMEESLKDCYKPRVLHIATHGYFQADASMNQDPLLRSGLMLAGAGQTLAGHKNDLAEDGILTAYEAMNLNLDNTDLVVLSACETGLGESYNGEGVYGLQRAFKIAGAQTIIMSLWKVNDQSTQELMSSFYQFWLDGKSKREAFDSAQRLLKAKYKNPYYWGAFVMVGE